MKIGGIYGYVIGLFVLSIIITVCISVGDTMSDTNRCWYEVEGVNVAFTAIGTDATLFNVSIYNNGTLISTTQTSDVYDTGWSNAPFSAPVRISSRESYTYVVNANGNFSIASDGGELSIYSVLL